MNGLANAKRLQDTMEELHGVVADCGEALRDAQSNMADAERIAADGGLLVSDGRIYPPVRVPAAIPVSGDEQHQDLLRDENLQEDFAGKEEAYESAQTKVEAGCQALESGLERLESLDDKWRMPYFTLADITAGGMAHEVGSRGQQRHVSSELYRQQGREMRRQGGEVAKSGNRHTNELQQMLEKWAGDDMGRANDLSRSARSLGLLGKVMKAAGPLLAVGNVTYDIYVEGDPAQKAIVTGGVNVAGSMMTLATIGFFVGTVGWGVIIVAGVLGYWLANAAGDKYDEIEPARLRLMRATAEGDIGTIGGG